MAHPEQLKFVELTSIYFDLNDNSNLRVIEIGSYIVNETVRAYFSKSEYIGVDLMPGPGVDIISNGEQINLPKETFDVAISCECFEHNPRWTYSFNNMWNMLKPGGLLIVSCASRGRLEHGTKRTMPAASPGTQSIEWNYYRNLNEKDFRNNLDLQKMFSKYIFAFNNNSRDLYFVGTKYGNNLNIKDWNQFSLKSELNKINQLIPRSPYYYLKKFLLSPLYLIAFLPEKIYQNIVFPYSKFLFWMRKLIIGDPFDPQK
jgi:SAM-dependent methyltransferase